MQNIKHHIKDLMGFSQQRFGYKRPPKLFFKNDEENAQDVLGKTAYYDPQKESITLFISARHPKDILRSLAHELVHHTQNLRGDLTPEKCGEMGMGYAQENPHMREMERQAYEQGNLCFRDWEDGYKKQMQEVKFLKESKKMTKKITKESLRGIITKLLHKQKDLVNEYRFDQSVPDFYAAITGAGSGMELGGKAAASALGKKKKMTKHEMEVEQNRMDTAMLPLAKKINTFAQEKQPGGQGNAINRTSISQVATTAREKRLLTDPVQRRKFIQWAKKAAKQYTSEPWLKKIPHLIAMFGNASTAEYGQDGPRVGTAVAHDISDPEQPKKPEKPFQRRKYDRVKPRKFAGNRWNNRQKKWNSKLGIKSMNHLRALVYMPKSEWPTNPMQSYNLDTALVAAIKKFQKKYLGLTGKDADGIVGPGTARKAAGMMKPGWGNLNVPKTRGQRRGPEAIGSGRTADDVADAVIRQSRRGVDDPEQNFALKPRGGRIRGLKESNQMFAPNHYCVHHGGVQHEGRIASAEVINHNWNKDLGMVTHYDMILEDGTILENVAFEDILVTEASLANEHMGHVAKRDDEEDIQAEGEECSNCKESPCKCEDEDEKPWDSAKKKAPEKLSQRKKKGRDFSDDTQNESKIYTPEQEEILVESRFGKRNDDIYAKLKNLWTK